MIGYSVGVLYRTEEGIQGLIRNNVVEGEPKWLMHGIIDRLKHNLNTQADLDVEVVDLDDHAS